MSRKGAKRFLRLDNGVVIVYDIYRDLEKRKVWGRNTRSFAVSFLLGGERMTDMISVLEQNPVIAAIADDKWEQALESPVQVIFYLSANLLTLQQRVKQAHAAGKYIMIHLDLAEGIGRDRTGLRFVASCGADGILTTKGQLIRFGKEIGLFTVQRFFAVDSSGADSIGDMFRSTHPDLIEIMPGVVTKVIKQYAQNGIPVIAGGLIQTKSEVTDALGSGAVAVSIGKPELWYI